jgi:hypothetical protein
VGPVAIPHDLLTRVVAPSMAMEQNSTLKISELEIHKLVRSFSDSESRIPAES